MFRTHTHGGSRTQPSSPCSRGTTDPRGGNWFWLIYHVVMVHRQVRARACRFVISRKAHVDEFVSQTDMTGALDVREIGKKNDKKKTRRYSAGTPPSRRFIRVKYCATSLSFPFESRKRTSRFVSAYTYTGSSHHHHIRAFIMLYDNNTIDVTRAHRSPQLVS